MAWQHIHLVRNLELPHIEKLLLFAVASRVDDSGECWPSIATLRKDTGLAQRTVQYHLRSLANRGMVLREERRGATGVLRLRLCDPCITASPTDVQDADTKERAVHPPVQDMHASSAAGAPEVTKELPINRHEPPSGDKLFTKPASQTRGSIGPAHAAKAGWWTSRAGIDAKGRELQITPRPGEDYDEYKQRLFAAEHQRGRSD
jgi:DNA-binding transcriptional ArsR family regulator